VWHNETSDPTRIIDGYLSESIFVTITGNIYVDNGSLQRRIDKLTLSATAGVLVMNVTSICAGLFIDTNNTLYCSLVLQGKVIKRCLNGSMTTPTIVAAGTDTSGSQPNQLSEPSGIFVDINFNLYVADARNNRIQLFQPGQLNAITIAGDGAPGTINLNHPIGIVLDADGYLFIVDNMNNRIVGSGPNGFRCLIGCTGSFGSSDNQLYNPRSMAFDSYGNIFITDGGNDRIQKLLLETNTCGECKFETTND